MIQLIFNIKKIFCENSTLSWLCFTVLHCAPKVWSCHSSLKVLKFNQSIVADQLVGMKYNSFIFFTDRGHGGWPRNEWMRKNKKQWCRRQHILHMYVVVLVCSSGKTYMGDFRDGHSGNTTKTVNHRWAKWRKPSRN